MFVFFEWFEDGVFGWGFAGGWWECDGGVDVEWLCPALPWVGDGGVAEGDDGECCEGEVGGEVVGDLDVVCDLLGVVGDPGGEDVCGEFWWLVGVGDGGWWLPVVVWCGCLHDGWRYVWLFGECFGEG